jgi:hypothetical protein
VLTIREKVSEKGKPTERLGRKASGLTPETVSRPDLDNGLQDKVAGPPEGHTLPAEFVQLRLFQISPRG